MQIKSISDWAAVIFVTTLFIGSCLMTFAGLFFGAAWSAFGLVLLVTSLISAMGLFFKPNTTQNQARIHHSEMDSRRAA